jgi:hypothetical protein
LEVLVHIPTKRLVLPVAGLAAVLAGSVAGCEPSTASAAGTLAAIPTPSATQTPLSAVKLAAKVTTDVSSFTGTMSLRVSHNSGAGGDTAMSATFTEQVRPLLASVDIQSLASAGTTLPGGVKEILTPSTIYLNWDLLTQTLHLARPWLAMGVGAMAKSTGVNFGQLFSEASSDGPLTESELLAGAASVRQVSGGADLDVGSGVPVTEYTGTIPLLTGLGFLSGGAKTQLQQAIDAEGFSTATFTAWIDAQHMVRQLVVTEAGKSVTQTVTTTITSVNQPAHVAVPPANQTAPLPGSDLG